MKMRRAGRTGRRGVAGIVAIVIIFAIIFTVGTSYYIFENAQNATYVSHLLAASNRVQGTRSESLSIITFLEGDGDIGFFANNTSPMTVNMTAALVISSTGALLQCDGVGFPAGAGCSNSTPALWMTINAGGGSPQVDTGYVYTPGTTDTVKVLTARGNTYSETYPAPASSSGSTQSVTVNLDNLKWVQLIPQSSSLTQKKFVANCNSASCAASYTSSVTAGNILVDAISWGSQAPPSGVPTDTLNDRFTLGSSASVVVSASPSIVQNKYTSNCNAASCGLAFTSSVTSGNTLVYAVGWANQNPPSSPTDTRGDSFTLGASQSVTVNPTSPAVVQHRYTANCNSATCALAYSSSVTAGNTLVFGLGWPSNQNYNYVPITITNNQGSATSNPFQQFITWNPSTYASHEASDLGNIRFCADPACVTQLYAWLESCTASCGTSATSASAWVKLTSSIAGSGGTLTIYMVFESTSTEFDGIYWGEAPTLSGTYGQYDNGGNVFSDYGAFQGSSLPSGWSVSGVASFVGGTSNTGGIRLTSNSGNQYGVATSSKSFSTVGACFETSAEYNGGADDIGQGFYSSGAGTATGGYGPGTTNGNGYYASYEYYSGSKPALRQSTSTLASSGSQTMPTSGTNFLYMETCSTSGQITMQYVTNTGSQYAGGVYSGLTTAVTYTATISAGASTSFLGAATGGSQSYTYIFWDRVRMNAPGGVMPSASLGSLNTGSGPPTLTDTLGDSFTQGVLQSATNGGTAYESGIWYATAGSSGADTITATFGVAVTGSVSIYEIAGYSTTGVLSSSGSSTGGSTSASVGSFTPSSNSFVVGNIETGSSSTKYTAGAGYTTVAGGAGGCDSSDASQGCNEYETGLGSATTTPFTLSASTPWADVALSFAPLSSNTYYSYIYYATAASAGADTITASFGATVIGSVSIYEISGVTATGLLSSTGSSSTSQGASSVTSITPSTGSVVLGNTEATSTTYTAGSGYTLSGSCSTVNGCGEYQTGVGSATTVPMSISPSAPWVEAAVAFAPITTTYYSYIWYATAGSSGADTVTATFGGTVTGSVSLYEITGYTTSGALSSTGSSSTGSTSATVTSFNPASDSFIVGNVKGASGSTTYTASSGFTLGGSCSSVGGCSEYVAGGGGSANTVPMTLSSSTPWVEAAMSFSTPFNPQSGIQVNGYPTMGVPSGASLVWEVTFTNVDSQHRSVTIWPQTELAIGSAEFDGFDTDYTQAHYYIIDSLNAGSTTVNAYTSTTNQYINLAYGVPTTLYFAATAALGSTTQAFGTNVLTPFEAYFAMTGIFSDGSLYGETIPYPYGIITQANAYTTPTAGSTGNTVTVSCTSPCYFTAGATAMVGWINSAGQLTQLTTFTVSGSGNIPAGVTFQVPSASAGYYTIEVTDYINTIFMTFQHT